MAEVARQTAVYEKEITRNLGLYETIAENIIYEFLKNINNIGDTMNYHIANVVFFYSITFQKLSGRLMLLMLFADSNKGAISSGSKPAMPHPTGVTKKCFSGLALAKAIKSLTYGRMVSTPPCMVGMA